MRVNNGLTPQELEAYGISDVHDIVYNPSYDLLYQEELDPSLTEPPRFSWRVFYL